MGLEKNMSVSELPHVSSGMDNVKAGFVITTAPDGKGICFHLTTEH